MANVVVMPKLGLTMKQGKIMKWFKQEGEPIQTGEKLFEVATDKLTNEVEANSTGIVRRLLAQEGDSIPCLKPIAIIAEANEDINDLIPNEEGAKPQQSAEIPKEKASMTVKESQKSISSGRVIASPAAKKLAKEKAIDLAQISGTGPHGRIVLEDVEKYKPDGRKASPMAEKAAGALGINLAEVSAQGRIMKEDVLRYHHNQQYAMAADPVEIKTPMSQMRSVIAERMTESWHISPAVTYDITVDMTQLKGLKEELKEYQRLTYTDFFVKLVAQALLEFPLLNSSVDGKEVITRNYVNMGVAVAIDNGLIVPVIQYAGQKGLAAISKEVKDLAHKAKTNQLSADELTGGTFTITNLGMYGIDSFSPIINQPEVAILGVNAITEVPALEKGTLISKPMMKLSLTADHRVADGAVAAKFLYRVKQYIEKPGLLLL